MEEEDNPNIKNLKVDAAVDKKDLKDPIINDLKDPTINDLKDPTINDLKDLKADVAVDKKDLQDPTINDLKDLNVGVEMASLIQLLCNLFLKHYLLPNLFQSFVHLLKHICRLPSVGSKAVNYIYLVLQVGLADVDMAVNDTVIPHTILYASFIKFSKLR